MKRYVRGFTLVELMIAVAIFGIVSLMAGGTTIAIMRSEAALVKKSDVAEGLSFFRAKMAQEMRLASRFELYETPDNLDRQRDGFMGDMLVLFFEDQKGELTKLVCFYRDGPGNFNGRKAYPVKRYQKEFKPALDLKGLSKSDYFPKSGQLSSANVFVDNVNGLFEEKDEPNADPNNPSQNKRLFLNLYDRMIMVRGVAQFEGYQGKVVKKSFNFAAAPRS